jgi:SNF2 family DNA or RNA helicase
MKLAMSGTMFEGSPRDLLGHFIDTVDERWWQFDLRMLKCTPENLMELAKEYEKIVVACGGAVSNKSRKKLNLRIRQYTRKLNAQLSLFLIRRTGQDKFFNYTIVPLPPMNVMALACQTPIQWLESIENYAALTQRELAANHATAMENWLRKGRQGPEPELRNGLARSSTGYFLRLAADFAAIPNLHNKYPEWTFHADEVYRIDWDSVPEDNFYLVHLKTLIDSSTKIQRLEKILASMSKKSKDWIAKGERKEKMVLATAHPAVLGILYLYFKKYQRDWKVVMISASSKMSIKKRIDVINGFCGREDSPYYASAFEADILLSTTPCVGTGLNLVIASHVVLFDLLWMRKDQEQAFCRVHRYPQTRETKLYLLHSPGNPIERDCLERQSTRGQLGEMTWQVTTGEAEAEQLKLKAQRRAEEKAGFHGIEMKIAV